MAKSNLTKEIENAALIWLHDDKYIHGVLECTLGYRKQYGIVDILGYKGKSVSGGRGRRRTREVDWYCYEIKTSKQDFYSKHKWTFIGDYNYFLLAEGLYDVVKDDVPQGVGVYEFLGYKRKVLNWYGENDKRNRYAMVPVFKLMKRPTRQKLVMDEKEIMHDFIVSATRDARRWVKHKLNT